MRHRRKKDPPQERVSAEWNSYQPYEPLYWAMGGPFVPVENIEAQPTNPDYIGGGMKGNARRKWVLKCMADSEADLAKAIARYLEVKTKGMEAIQPWVREAWRQKAHVCETQGVPDPVSEAMAYAYRDIRYHRGRIAACTAALDAMERGNSPLLFWRGNP
jgi:hypothetical protein